MTDTTTAEQMHTETEASREVAAQAAPDDPNPDRMPDVRDQRTESVDLTSDIAHPSSEAKPLERITASDRGRAEIAARFKEKRAGQGGQVEFHGDMRDPSQTYGPYAPSAQMSDVAGQRSEESLQPARQQPATEEAQLVQPAPPSSDIRHPTSDIRSPSSEPRLVKVKVHGREAWLAEDEVIAEAQKSLAAGNLLESAKEVLSGARGQMSDVKDQMSDVRDQMSESNPTSDIRPLSSDPYVALAQTLQLENAEAAGTRLKQTIEHETARARQEAAREATRHVRIENELAASGRALAAFEQSHPDLAADEFARDAIATQAQREINADLQAAVRDGILKELPPTQDERNGLHTQLRAFGVPVRAIGDIIDAAGTKYATWRGHPIAQGAMGTPRGGTPAPQPASVPQPQPASAAAAPRVELSPDRAQRRAGIVTQPTNGTVPPRSAPSLEQTTAQRRSAAITAMRKARGQIVA
jgi:hypothetical protein